LNPFWSVIIMASAAFLSEQRILWRTECHSRGY